MHIQNKPDKSAIEEVYQTAYQSRQTDVPREQIAVQTQHSGHPHLPTPMPISNAPSPNAGSNTRTAPRGHAVAPAVTQPSSSTSHAAASRRRAFEEEMTRLQRDEAAAFQLLDMPQQYDLKLLAKKYRKAALKYHPDRVRRHAHNLPASQVAQIEGMFEKVTKAYLLLMERHTQQEENRPFYELRDRSRAAVKEQARHQQSTGTQIPDSSSRVRLRGSGDQFDVKLFNKIYDDHRLHAPSDSGYGDWFQANNDPNFDPENPPKLFSSRFNKDIFNTTFEQLKRDDPNAEKQLAKREEMGVVVHGSTTAYSALGGGQISDYGGNTASLQYSDLKSAHTTHATLIDTSRVQPENPMFRNVEDLEAHRSQVSHHRSPEETERQSRIQKQQEVEEEQRRERVRYMDQLGAEQEQRLGQLLLR
jgi:curved DNA-binding protein CbpA